MYANYRLKVLKKILVLIQLVHCDVMKNKKQLSDLILKFSFEHNVYNICLGILQILLHLINSFPYKDIAIHYLL